MTSDWAAATELVSAKLATQVGVRSFVRSFVRFDLTLPSDTVVCPGHFGHINLARPVYHINFIDYCVKVLRCVCFNCSAVRAHPEEPRLNEVKMARNNRRKMALLVKLCQTMQKCLAPVDQRGLVAKDPKNPE